jgi:flagellar motility protein MotE (MotC chaperone)
VIITRQRRKRTPWRRYLVPAAIIGAFLFLVEWPPSQNAIANSPLRPFWLGAGRVVSVVAGPLTFAAQQQQITDRNRTIQTLNAQLEKQRAAAAADSTKVQQLQQQLAAMASQPRPTAIPAVRPSAVAAAPAAVADADRRLAATWAAMDPEKAAAVVQRLPDDQVVRVLAQMDADSAGQIMNALPAGVAARLSRTAAQVGSGRNR